MEIIVVDAIGEVSKGLEIKTRVIGNRNKSQIQTRIL